VWLSSRQYAYLCEALVNPQKKHALKERKEEKKKGRGREGGREGGRREGREGSLQRYP
jgi:hypothetical protein